MWLRVVSIGLLVLAGVFVYGVVQGVLNKGMKPQSQQKQALPFYNDLPAEEQRAAADLYRRYHCRDCHVIWGVRNVMQMPPAPSLDGIGSLKSEAWIYRYLSAENPQAILPSRLKKEYRHPSYAEIPEAHRRLLARYFAHMKARPWYIPRLVRAEQEVLGKGASDGR